MKQTFFKYLPLVLALLVLVFVLARSAGIIVLFNIPTESMMPNYAPNSTAFACKWIKPVRNDVVLYYDTCVVQYPVQIAKKSSLIGRVIALEGDKIEISEGRVFINEKLVGADLHLDFFWEISKNDFRANQQRFDIAPVDFGHSMLVAMEVPKANAMKEFVPMQMFDIQIFSKSADNIWGAAGTTWTLNNFGPISVPKGQVFILGDNRHNNEDSRYHGFVPESDIFGSVLN